MLAGEIAAQLNVLPNSLSANLTVLNNAGLIVAERQGRSIRYHARPERIVGLALFLLRDCCGGRPGLCGPSLDRIIHETEAIMTDKPFNVLFLCTANSARSLIGEAILNAEPSGRFWGFSAGSHPSGQPNPHAMQLLERQGYDTAGLRSKSWDEFGGPDAPQMNFVFTVCDNAAAETCPVWPGHPVSAQWSVPDPAAATGTEAEIAHAFNRAHRLLSTRIG
ncbi:MAG: ArsR family transcriptional regulator, partial [Paracoccus sp. (in: a-proteobacteria)]|nr:ArsR family transcriptional regulator [Paracoccus sp. (in: a-proteobacteria)]